MKTRAEPPIRPRAAPLLFIIILILNVFRIRSAFRFLLSASVHCGAGCVNAAGAAS